MAQNGNAKAETNLQLVPMSPSGSQNDDDSTEEPSVWKHWLPMLNSTGENNLLMPIYGEETSYDVLGVSPEASQKQIVSAYRLLAYKTHPDKADPEKQEERTRKFQELSEAYRGLCTPEERQKYKSGLLAKRLEMVRAPMDVGPSISEELIELREQQTLEAILVLIQTGQTQLTEEILGRLSEHLSGQMIAEAVEHALATDFRCVQCDEEEQTHQKWKRSLSSDSSKTDVLLAQLDSICWCHSAAKLVHCRSERCCPLLKTARAAAQGKKQSNKDVVWPMAVAAGVVGGFALRVLCGPTDQSADAVFDIGHSPTSLYPY